MDEYYGAIRGFPCAQAEAEVEAWGCLEAKGPLERIFYKHSDLKPDELIVELLYTGLCHSDHYKLHALWDPAEYSPWPMIAGHEIIGKVLKIGSEVAHFMPGDIVGATPHRDCCGFCANCKRGDDNLCMGDKNEVMYDPYFGAYATQVKLSQAWTFKIPDGMDLKRLAPIMCAGLTCFAPLRNFGKVGWRCAVVGVGGLGHMGVQFASKMGMEVTAVSTSADKAELCSQLGAHHFLNMSDTKDAQAFSRAGFDLILNTGLAHNLQPMINALRKGGILIQVGLPEADKPLTFEHMSTITQQKTIVGGYIGNRESVESMLKFAKLHNIYPMVEVFAFDEFPKAYARMVNERPKFRVVVDVKSYLDKQQQK